MKIHVLHAIPFFGESVNFENTCCRYEIAFKKVQIWKIRVVQAKIPWKKVQILEIHAVRTKLLLKKYKIRKYASYQLYFFGKSAKIENTRCRSTHFENVHCTNKNGFHKGTKFKIQNYKG